jgi:hypothetical protein
MWVASKVGLLSKARTYNRGWWVSGWFLRLVIPILKRIRERIDSDLKNSWFSIFWKNQITTCCQNRRLFEGVEVTWTHDSWILNFLFKKTTTDSSLVLNYSEKLETIDNLQYQIPTPTLVVLCLHIGEGYLICCIYLIKCLPNTSQHW